MTKIKILQPLLILTILGFVLFVGGTMPYFLFYILLLIYLIPLGHILINLLWLKGSVDIPSESLFSGDNITIQYNIKNNSFLPITYLEIQSDISKQLTGVDSPNISLSLDRKRSYSTKETILLKRRGYYQVGEINVIIKDVFGLFSFKKKIRNSTSLLVYPEITKLSTFKITASQQLGDLLIEDSAFQDKSRVSSIREYTEGDPVKSIHWKLSSKVDIPMVKDFENRGDTYGVILIDNEGKLYKNDTDGTMEDKAVDTALSIINYFLSQNMEVKLETQNYQNYIEILGNHKSNLKSFLETLAKFKANGSFPLKSVLVPRIETFKKGATIIIITPNLDKSMGAQGIYLKMKNLNPLFIVITNKNKNLGYVDQAIEKRLRQEGIPVYIMDYRNSIKEVLEVYYE